MTIFLAILAALVLLPEAAAADPVTTALTTFFTSVGASAATATLLASATLRAVVGLGLSLLGQMFQDKPKVKQSGIQTEQTTAGDTTPLTFIVGRYATEGHLIAPGYSRGDNNKILTQIMDVSNLPVKGLTGRVIINGEFITLGNLVGPADDRLEFVEFGVDDYGGNPFGWLWFYDGTQTSASWELRQFYSTHPDRPWTEDHVLEGTAYAVCEFVLNREIYSGFPRVRFEVDGISLYDPRKDSSVGGSGEHRWDDPSTWEFSKNPQVINYNILRGITLPNGDIYGGQIPAEDLPLDNWFAAMNACDALIGDRPAYEAGFEVDVSQEPFEIIKEMNKASFAQMSELGGVFKVRVGAPASPVLSITDDDIVITKPSDLNPFPGLAQTSNAITGTYVEPNDVWQGRSADPIYNATWESDDGGRRLTNDVGLPAVTKKSQAQHLLNSYINDNRRFKTHGIVLPASFATLEPLDTIEWTSDRNGYVAKVFEVVDLEDQLDTMLQFVRVREREATDSAWTPGDDVPDPAPFSNLTPPDRLTPDITVTAVEQQDGDGDARRPAIKIEWPVDEATADLLEYEVRLLGASGELTTSAAVGREAGEAVTSDGIIPAENYQVRARYVSDMPMDWSAWLPVTTSDTRLSAKDIVDALNDKIDTAFDRHDETLTTLTPGGAVFNLLNEVRIEDAILAAQDVIGGGHAVVEQEATDNAFAAIATEQTVRADEDSALAQQITALTAEVDDNAAAIVTEQTARADGDSAIASDVTTLTSRVGDNESDISNIQTTKVDASGAIAAVETQISAEYNGLTAMATATGFAEATADNIAAGYVWRLNGQNLLELVSTQTSAETGPTSTFRIDADYVQITGLTQIDQAVINSLAVDNGFISNLTVDTLNIAGQAVDTDRIQNGAVTAPIRAAGAQLTGNGSWQAASSVTIGLKSGAECYLVLKWAFQQGYVTTGPTWGFRIKENGTIIQSRLGMTAMADYPSSSTQTPVFTVLPTSNGSDRNLTYSLEWNGSNSDITAWPLLDVQAFYK